MPVRDEGYDMSEFNDTCDCQEAPSAGTKVWRWHKVWNFRFRRCDDTNKIIWPFTKAYASYPDKPSSFPAEWLTPEAYTFRKLKGRT